MKKIFYLYILSNYTRTVLYIGSTSNLIRRIHEHRINSVPGFTNKYQVKYLMYYESCEDMETILRREIQMKRWRRSWKNSLINNFNPEWKDLYHEILI